jgi:hypothetical protein
VINFLRNFRLFFLALFQISLLMLFFTRHSAYWRNLVKNWSREYTWINLCFFLRFWKKILKKSRETTLVAKFGAFFLGEYYANSREKLQFFQHYSCWKEKAWEIEYIILLIMTIDNKKNKRKKLNSNFFSNLSLMLSQPFRLISSENFFYIHVSLSFY